MKHVEFLYLVAAIACFIAAFVDSEHRLLFIVLGCINAVWFKIRLTEKNYEENK